MTDSYPIEKYLTYESHFTYAGKAELWLNVTQSSFDFAGGHPPVMLYLTGNTGNNTTLKKFQFRPNTGYFAKCDNLIEDRQATPDPQGQSASNIPHFWEIKDEKYQVTGDIKYSRNPLITRYIKPGNNNASNTKVRIYGGRTDRPDVPLLVIRRSFEDIPAMKNILECHYYQHGNIMPAPEPTVNKGVSTAKMLFLPAMQKTSTGACQPIGNQVVFEWFVRVKADGTNELLGEEDIYALLKVA